MYASTWLLPDTLQHSIQGLWLKATLAGFPPACQQTISSPHAHRLAIFRTADNCHHVVWSCHHLFLDGWSAAIVLNEVLGTYALLCSDLHPPPLSPPACTYRDYFAWLKKQDPREARQYWSHELRGVDKPVLLADHDRRPSFEVPETKTYDTVVPPDIAEAVADVAASHQLTPNCILQGAWALIVGATSGRADVVFGTTVSGRAGSLPGIDTLVGFLSNVVPIRVHVDPDRTVGDWLHGLRDAQFTRQPHERATLADIWSWSRIPGNQPMFDSLLVVENLPFMDFGVETGGLRLTDFSSGITSAYPLTVVVRPGDQWNLHGIYDASHFTIAQVSQWVERLPKLAHRLVTQLDEPLKRVMPPSAVVSTSAPAPSGGSALAQKAAFEAPTHLPPRNETELDVARIWEEVLGVHPIGARDGFFHPGRAVDGGGEDRFAH